MKDLSPLAAFQDGFARILVTEKADPEYAALVCQPGFSVYRNTVMKGCMDALQANFPAVVKLVGEPWFREAARIYVSERPPLDARLLFYGEDFPDFLSGFPPAADWPYLPGVARLDRFWIECQTALDDEAQDPAKLLTLAPDALGATVVRPRAMTRWKWFEGMPVYTIWCVNRSGASTAATGVAMMNLSGGEKGPCLSVAAWKCVGWKSVRNTARFSMHARQDCRWPTLQPRRLKQMRTPISRN
jgi:hypothetical protein